MKMVSFDIVSLYTNVPVETAIEWLEDFYHEHPFNIPVKKEIFFPLIRLCFSSSFFSFEGGFYIQKRGLPMGSPASPVIANLFLELFERKFLRSIFNKNCIFYRYVDDTLAVVPIDFDVANALESLNKLHPNVQFTMEESTNRRLPFLDVLIDFTRQKPIFTVYRKPTHIDSYVHWFSSHNTSTKRGVLIGQFLRALRLSSQDFLEEEIEKVRKIFKNLAYPDFFVNSAYASAKKKFYDPRCRDKKEMGSVIILPCPPTAVLKSLTPDKVMLVTKLSSHISSSVFTSRSSDSRVNIGGIYEIPCSDCPLTYIGETDDFKRRLNQHQHSLRVGDQNSSLHKHREEMDHRINLKGATLNVRACDKGRRRFLENFYINTIETYNHRKDDMDPLILKILQKKGGIPPWKPPD
jgi:hypothetical protein